MLALIASSYSISVILLSETSPGVSYQKLLGQGVSNTGSWKIQDAGVELMIGTDNVFITEPDLFAEMDFLYRYQRFNTYISPSEILRFCNKHVICAYHQFYPG